MSYEVPYDTLALVAETGQSHVYMRGNKWCTVTVWCD